MTLYELDPLTDRRWVDLTDHHPNASVFHSRAWLTALQRTYGYEPIAFTLSGPGEPLRNALVFCRVKSWLTGRRLVSLPFSDHCEPLVESRVALQAMLVALERSSGEQDGRYIELRPLIPVGAQNGFKPAAVFYRHVLDLRCGTDAIFAGFHKSCIQRAIRKAERSGVQYEVGRAEPMLSEFYRLQALTRSNHYLPVQPLRWFENLVQAFGNRLSIYAARYERTVIAAILVLNHGQTCVYKYGCLDRRYKRLGAAPFLLWQAITDAHGNGAAQLDLGRSDPDGPGLAKFKERLGGKPATLTYFRYSPYSLVSRRTAWRRSIAAGAFWLVPGPIRDRVGSRLYGHFA